LKNIINRETIHNKIQLWTNESETEYALTLMIAVTDDYYDKFEDSFLARTDHNKNANYVHLIAESDYLQDLKYGWDYTLRRFIEQYNEMLKQKQFQKEGYLHQKYKNKSNSVITKNNPSSPENKIENHSYVNRDQKYYRYPIKLISHLKCHYCDLHLLYEKERKEHEIE
jgi:hypothetical protein